MRRILKSLVVISIILLGTSSGYATDLAVKFVINDWGDYREEQGSSITVRIGNENVLAAKDYTLHLTMKKLGETELEYDEEFDCPEIDPFTEIDFKVPIDWTPRLFGAYTLKAELNFADEINPENNTLEDQITVEPRLFRSRLLRQLIEAPYESTTKDYSALEYTYSGSDDWRYLNIRAWNVTDDWTWLVKNKPIPPNTDSVTMVQTLPLDGIIQDSSQSTVRFAFGVSTDTASTDTVLKAYTDLEFIDVKYSYGGVLDDDAFSLTLDGVDYEYSSGQEVEGLTIGCTMPNIDLDNSVNGPNAETGYAGDLNACAVAAAANSMQWLDDTWSDINPGISHRQKLEELSKMMLRDDTTGVWSEDFIAAKLQFINKYNLPIKVKFQRRGSTTNVESQDDYLSVAENQGDGKYPVFNWVQKEVQDSEDVEMFVEFHADSGNGSRVTGRHVVAITGAHLTTSSNELWYKDDGWQQGAGGEQQRAVTWDTIPGGVPYFEPWKSGNEAHITVPYAIVSESRDTSVHRKGRGLLQWLGSEVWGMLYGRNAGVTNSIDWQASTSLRFASAIINQHFPPTATPVGNVLGEAVMTTFHESLYNLGDTTSSIRGAVWYADTTLADTSSDAVRLYPWTIERNSDTWRRSSITTSLETYVAPDTNITVPLFTDGPFVPVDTSTAWLRTVSMDIDSAGAADYYESPLTDRGAQGEAALGSAFKALSSDTTFPLSDIGFKIRADLSVFTGRSLGGTTREGIIQGALRYTDQNNLPVRVEFQSSAIEADSIAPEGAVRSAQNRTSASGAPDRDYLLSSLRRAPVVVEIGEYQGATRLGGFFALCTGYLEYNGVRQIVLDRDFQEGAEGGLTRTVQHVIPEAGHLVLPEMAAPSSRAVVESFVAMYYDPTISSVGEDLSREIDRLSIYPNPAGSSITIRAQIYRSSMATVIVSDVTGSEVVRLVTPVDALQVGLPLDLSSFANGIYVVRVATPHAQQSSTFAKTE